MKKYYKSLDLLLLAACAAKDGRHEEAAKHFVAAMDEEDSVDLLEDLNDSNEEATEDCDTPPAVAMFKVMARMSKKVVKAEEEELEEVEEEETAEEDEEDEETASEDNSEGDDVQPKPGDNVVEDEVVARMKSRKARASSNKKALAKKAK